MAIQYFDEDLKDDTDWFSLKRRLNKPARKSIRMKTGLQMIDEIVGGGLPMGLTILYGEPGTGKSNLAKTIAKAIAAQGKKIIYFYGEDSIDAPEISTTNPYVNTVDLITAKYGPEKTTKHILKFLQELQPEFAVIDSLTTIWGATTKAVPEADVREQTLVLAQHIAGKIPVLATSEIRGKGYNQQAAGGFGVLFPGLLVIEMAKKRVEAKWDEERYGVRIGQAVYTLFIDKDREGCAKQNREFKIEYLNGEPLLS